MLIVTGFDGSAHAERAVHKADELADRLGADLHIVMVAHITALGFPGLASPYPVDLYAIEEDRLREEIASVVQELRVDPSVMMVRGNPALELTSYAEKHSADLLVVGSRGRGAVATMLLGSTSHGVLWHSKCDLLIVR